MDIKNGDVVKLKSGGPRMTVIRVSSSITQSNPGVTCKWFVNDEGFEEVRQGSFSSESLVRQGSFSSESLVLAEED